MELSLSANDVAPFEPPKDNGVRHAPPPVRGWHVEVHSRDQIDRLAALVDEWPGDVPLVMHAHGKTQKLSRTVAHDFRLRSELERIFGAGNVREAVDA